MKVGFYDPYLDTLAGGERYLLTLAEHLSQTQEVEIFWRQDLSKQIKERLALNMDRVQFVNNIFNQKISRFKKWQKTSKYNVLFYLSDGSIPLSFAKKNILHFQMPFNNFNGNTLLNELKLRFFKQIICNSFFTKKFIDKTYGVKSRVIYPPVDLKNYQVLKKEKIILSVARFSPDKKQEIMIKAFKTMKLKNWRLILIGGLLETEKQYFHRLEKESFGYSIELLPNIDFNTLRENYGRAMVYWHAKGFGEKEKINPELFEHFGISTVEAMASGCVPIVYDGGGQKEIVSYGINGFLWQTDKELIEQTLRIIMNDDLRKKIIREAGKRSRDFSKEVFLRRFDEIIDQ